MDIPNLSQNYQAPITSPTASTPSPKKNLKNNNTKFIVLIVLVLAIVNGFWVSRFLPTNKSTSESNKTSVFDTTISTENIKDKSQIEVDKTYGDSEKTFKDSATGTVEAGSINGEGTHILSRDGGASQRVSLISSTVDLDLFVGRKVEIKGETNASNKTGWLVDVGSVKVLQ